MGPSDLNWSLGHFFLLHHAKVALENDLSSLSVSLIENINSHQFAPVAPTFNLSSRDLGQPWQWQGNRKYKFLNESSEIKTKG